MQNEYSMQTNIRTRIILPLIFVFSLGVFNPVYGTIGICLFICLRMTVFVNRRILVPASFSLLWLLLFGVSYVVFGQLSISYFVQYLVAVLLAFSAGGYCSGIINSDLEKTTKTIIYIIILAEACHALLNTIVNIGTVRWELIDFFRGARSATGSAFINTFVLSITFIVIFIEKTKLARLLGFLSIGVAVVYSFILGTRTTYLVAAIVFVINLLLYFHENLSIKKYLRLITVLLVILLVLAFAYNRDILGIRTLIEHSNLFVRFTEVGLDQSDKFRVNSVFTGFQSLLEHPLGGQIELRYFHNMWLDAGRVGGIFPFLFLTLYSINTLIHVLHLFKNKELDIVYRYMVLSIYLGLMVNCFTEPVLEGIMESFLVFIFINGLVESDYMKLRHKYRT